MKKVIGKGYSTTLNSVLGEDGFWTTVCTIAEILEYEDGTTASAEVSAKAVDKDNNNSNQTSLRSALMQYRAEVIDPGFNNLIEARGEEANDTSEINTDTPS